MLMQSRVPEKCYPDSQATCTTHSTGSASCHPGMPDLAKRARDKLHGKVQLNVWTSGGEMGMISLPTHLDVFIRMSAQVRKTYAQYSKTQV